MTALPRGGRPAEALSAVEATIDGRWRLFLAEYGVAAGAKEETDLADMVVADTSAFEWRVVDAALDRLSCTDCGNGLGLPGLLDGELPSTAQAQAYRAAINKLTEEECERVTSFEEVTEVSSRRGR
ncbi:hypothetical protein GCM10027598_83080 [Amycolatopsis oliviviridis]|uniref:Uncharacterized protein n=1 Tax=Amycolatopsis oliviviridis TaxID=1471590 RepID=A0ABQ3L6N9_9PSEU|nr:hypothetical protein [Amycolatopsis oliviviridis]GHH06870.1 hypothetical protein GCM10017790_12980 [Amycolatopsis oliviviridis]